jgi:hypothetical protein
MLANMGNITKLHLAEKVLLGISLLIAGSILLGAIIEVNSTLHEIFTVQALLWFFLASALCTALAATRLLSAQLAALFVNLYFLHRVPILYFLPELMDYPNYLGHSQEIIETGALYFFLCVFFLGLGISYARTFRNFNVSNRLSARTSPIAEPVSFFILKTSWQSLVRISLPVGAILLAIQIFSLVKWDIGITGAVRDSADMNTILAITEMTKFLSPIAVFGYLVSIDQDDPLLRKKSKVILGIVIFSALLVASRAAFFALAISFYVGVRFLNLKNQSKYTNSLFLLMAIGVVAYPLITYSRYLFLDADAPFDVWLSNFNFIKEVSGRLGVAVESYFLWFKYINAGAAQSLPTFAVQIYDAINALVPGEIIQYEPLVNVAKLQSYIGRPEQANYQSLEFLNELGGGGENPGSYGMAFMFFERFFCISFFFAGLLCSTLESSRVSSFWKFYWAPFLLTTPWLVPSNALVHQTVIVSGLIVLSAYITPATRTLRPELSSGWPRR